MAVTPIRVRQIEQSLRLPPSLDDARIDMARAVATAEDVISTFASAHGWLECMQPFFPHGIELFETQAKLWHRILNVCGAPEETPLPTGGLAAALEGGVLLAVTPTEYARVAPEYGGVPGAFVRLLAHEIAHRLHVSILNGDEDGMGPPWFYEGFAVVASGDLLDQQIRDHSWEALTESGPGAYRRYGALLRVLMTAVALPELVRRARRADFEEWARRIVEATTC